MRSPVVVWARVALPLRSVVPPAINHSVTRPLDSAPGVPTMARNVPVRPIAVPLAPMAPPTVTTHWDSASHARVAVILAVKTTTLAANSLVSCVAVAIH